MICCIDIASACAMCGFSIVDRYVPPVYYWSFLVIGWTISIEIINMVFSIKDALLQTTAKRSLLLIGAFIIASFMLIGPLGILPFIPLSSIAFHKAVRKRDPYQDNRKARIGVLTVSYIAVILMCVGVVWSIRIHRTRTDVDFYLMWSGNVTGRELMQKFKQQEPASIDKYRYIVDHGKDYAIESAAERLGVIGDPQVDIPRLENAKERYRHYIRNSVQEAIDSLLLRVKKKGGPEHDKVK